MYELYLLDQAGLPKSIIIKRILYDQYLLLYKYKMCEKTEKNAKIAEAYN